MFWSYSAISIVRKFTQVISFGLDIELQKTLSYLITVQSLISLEAKGPNDTVLSCISNSYQLNVCVNKQALLTDLWPEKPGFHTMDQNFMQERKAICLCHLCNYFFYLWLLTFSCCFCAKHRNIWKILCPNHLRRSNDTDRKLRLSANVQFCFSTREVLSHMNQAHLSVFSGNSYGMTNVLDS